MSEVDDPRADKQDGDTDPDKVSARGLPAGLDPIEEREAYRALKGRALRIETYADDGAAGAANPYTVVEQNFTLVRLQSMGANPHAVFFVHPRETVTFNYERGGADPRVAHELTLETDLYGRQESAKHVHDIVRAPARDDTRPAAWRFRLQASAGR